MQPDFRVLDAYLDLWQQLAAGHPAGAAFVDGLLAFAPYQPSLQHYQNRYSLEQSELRSLLLSLSDPVPATARPDLQAFWRSNQQAVGQIGQRFDIIFPLRRLNLTHALHQAGLVGPTVPPWLRIQPELRSAPYLVPDALVLDFFSLQIDPAGHIVVADKPLAEHVVAALSGSIQVDR